MNRYQTESKILGPLLSLVLPLALITLPNRVSAQMSAQCTSHSLGGSLNINTTNCSGQVDQQGLSIVHLGDFVGLTITVRNNNDSFNGSFCRGDHYVITSMVISNITGGYAINSNLVGAPFTCPGGTQVGGRFPELLPANLNFADCGSCITNALTNPQCTQYSPLYQSQGAPNNATVIIQITNTGRLVFSGSISGYITNASNPLFNGLVLSLQPADVIATISPKLCVSVACATNGGSGDAQRYTFTASVTNCGDAVVNNIFITNQFSGGSAVTVAGPLTLNPGDVAITFSTNIAANCVAVTDTVTAAGQDELFCPVVASNNATCQSDCPPLILRPTLNGTNFTFSFATVSGMAYLAQYKNSVTDSEWQALSPVAGDGTSKTITVPFSAAPQRFYRLLVQ